MVVRAHFMGSFFDAAAGTTLTSATVQVFQPGTVTNITATVFDKNGNALTLPLTSDATTGLVDFYLTVAQEVDLQVSKTGFTTRTYSNVPVIDDSSFELTALMTTTGDIVYASAANVPARLGIGATGSFLNNTGGLPAWNNTISAGGLTITAGGLTITAGGLTITAGGLTVTAGGITVSGTGTVTIAGTSAAAPAGALGLGATNPVLGGGATATLGSIGGSGPTTAAQQAWLKAFIGSTAIFFPYWI